MRTTIEIDEKLIVAVMKATGVKTKHEAVALGLSTILALKRQDQIRRRDADALSHAMPVLRQPKITKDMAMNRKSALSEESMCAMEAHIPELAAGALKRAYYQALTTRGTVLEAVNGKLVETSADGGQRVIRVLSPPVPVIAGSKRIRRSSR